MMVFIVLMLLPLVAIYFIDRYQTKSSLKRNYPILARFRYLFEYLGKFFRQYFFAQDREEMPFYRAQRSWIYQAAKNLDTNIAFGSTKHIDFMKNMYFVHSMFPMDNSSINVSTTIGEYCEHPYSTQSIFHISGMSFGALSVPAIKALSRGAKAANILLNTGEGGLSSYHLEGDCDLVFQIGTAKFGVRDKSGRLCKQKLQEIASHKQVKMFEIKLSQGAKPGKGGMLPAIKVSQEIAQIRGIEVGYDSISPNRHAEINSVDDLLQLIHQLKDIVQKPVGFKLAVGSYEFFIALCKAIHIKGFEYAPDFITIDSADGGTGAAPMSLADDFAVSIKESLPMVDRILRNYKLRRRIKIFASGKLITPSEIAWALCAGADFVNSARGFMFALGCIQSLVCNKDTCPTGVATHNKSLQYGLDYQNKAVRVANYATKIHKELCVIALSCGLEHPSMLEAKHMKIIVTDGFSVSLDQYYQELYDNHIKYFK